MNRKNYFQKGLSIIILSVLFFLTPLYSGSVVKTKI